MDSGKFGCIQTSHSGGSGVRAYTSPYTHVWHAPPTGLRTGQVAPTLPARKSSLWIFHRADSRSGLIRPAGRRQRPPGLSLICQFLRWGNAAQLMPPGFEFRGRYVRSRAAAIDQFPFSDAVRRHLVGPEKLRAAGVVLQNEGELFEIDGTRKVTNVPH